MQGESNTQECVRIQILPIRKLTFAKFHLWVKVKFVIGSEESKTEFMQPQKAIHHIHNENVHALEHPLL